MRDLGAFLAHGPTDASTRPRYQHDVLSEFAHEFLAFLLNESFKKVDVLISRSYKDANCNSSSTHKVHERTMPLVIILKTKTSIPVEVDSIQLETVAKQSTNDVKATLVQYGNKQVPLGEFFEVTGSAADDNCLVWEGDCAHVKLIGTKLRSGHIRVDGNAGMHLGAEMTGGEIIVNGNATDWVGAEMHGGRIHVHGDAGHLVGAVYRGGYRGMTGGEILIDGNAGNEIGHSMRRGLIAVGGKAGDAAGVNMIAGTVLLFGNTGIRPGAGMRRGTIGLLDSDNPPDMLPTFKYACKYRPIFLRLYLRHLQSCRFSVPEDSLDAEFHRHCGDFLEDGKGEILIRAAK